MNTIKLSVQETPILVSVLGQTSDTNFGVQGTLIFLQCGRRALSFRVGVYIASDTKGLRKKVWLRETIGCTPAKVAVENGMINAS